MDWDIDVFTITIQPNPGKTFNQAGTFQINERLNDQQTAGVLLMAYNIFGDDYYHHIGLQLYKPKGEVLFRPEYFFDRFLVTAAKQFLLYDPYRESWTQYIYRLAARAGIYSLLPKNITKPYTVRFFNTQTNSSAIHQFETLSFIQGAISVTRWFKLDWRRYMDNLHTGDEKLEII